MITLQATNLTVGLQRATNRGGSCHFYFLKLVLCFIPILVLKLGKLFIEVWQPFERRTTWNEPEHIYMMGRVSRITALRSSDKILECLLRNSCHPTGNLINFFFLKRKVLLLYILSKKYKQGHLSEFRGSKLWSSPGFSTVSNIKMCLFLYSIHQQVVLLRRVRYGWGIQGSQCQTARHKAHFLFLQLKFKFSSLKHMKKLEG